MTWQFDVNNLTIYSSNDVVGPPILGLIDLLVAQGAVSIVGSGDGVSNFENEGQTPGPYNVLTSGATVWNTSAQNTFSATQAWIRFRMTGTTLEFVFQRSSATSITYTSYLNIKISPTGFDSDDADANNPPTATDEEFIIGTGTTIGGLFIGYNESFRWSAACEDTAQDGFYPFYLVFLKESDKVVDGVMLFDVVQSKITGDTQPWVFYVPGDTRGFAINEIGANYGRGYKDYGGTEETFLTSLRGYFLQEYNSADLFPGVAAQYDGKARSFPLVWGHPTGPFYKGVSRNFLYKGLNVIYPNTSNLATSDAKIFIDDVMLPWKQNETPS
jgi:hypothetical protein